MLSTNTTNQQSAMLRRRQSIETNASTGTTTSSDLRAVLRDIPKMELLPMSYVGRKSNITPSDAPIKPPKVGKSYSSSSRFDNIMAFKQQVLRKSQTVQHPTPSSSAAQKPPIKSSYNPLKYVVYKKHNQVSEPKLQYINDAAASSHPVPKTMAKKKFFENDRKAKSKSDTIQFVFANTDCERHVDNQMYDCIVPINAKADSDGDRCNSWQYRKHPQMVSSLQSSVRTRDTKIAPMRQKFMLPKSTAPSAIVTDATRIRQMFDSRPVRSESDCKDETAGSLKKVKKLVDNFENRCSCKEEQPLPPVQKPRLSPLNIHRKVIRNGNLSSSNDVRATFQESLSKILSKGSPDPKHAIKKLDDLTNCTPRTTPATESSGWYGRCPSPGTLSADTVLANEDFPNKLNEKSANLPCGLPTAESINNLKNLKDIRALGEVNAKFAKAGLNINNPVANKHIHKDEFNVVRHLNRKLSNLTISLPMDDIQKNTTTKSISTLFLNHPTQEESSTDSSTDMGYFGSIVASDASEMSSASSTSSSSLNLRQKRIPSNNSQPEPIERQPSKHPVSHHLPSIDQQKSTSQRMSRLFPSRHGCDGAIFWNDCYYYDDEPVSPSGISSKYPEPVCCNDNESHSICSYDLDQVGFS